jgi:Domain of unknown function (DUF4357)
MGVHGDSRDTDVVTTEPTRGVTIRIFLVDGAPQGLRLVERMSWTGSFLAFARADYPSARVRVEVSRTGVYVLVGPDPDGQRAQRIYVGEADNIRVRLDAHQKEKDFWTHGYVLTTKDDSLNKAHVRYLEARLLELAGMADNAFLDNGTAPVPVRLSEPEIAEMETYLDNALPLFVLVGVNVFEPAEEPVAAETATEAQSEPVVDERPARLYLNTQLTQAEGEDRSRGFLVFEGAIGRKEKKVMISGYGQLRDRLVQEGILVEEGEHVRLMKSHLFDSPSAAASVLSGGNKNGRTEWRDAAGHTLKDLQAQTAGSEDGHREQETNE